MFSLALGHAETCEKQGLGLIVDWILSLLQFSCFHSSSPSFTRETTNSFSVLAFAGSRLSDYLRYDRIV